MNEWWSFTIYYFLVLMILITQAFKLLLKWSTMIIFLQTRKWTRTMRSRPSGGWRRKKRRGTEGAWGSLIVVVTINNKYENVSSRHATLALSALPAQGLSVGHVTITDQKDFLYIAVLRNPKLPTTSTATMLTTPTRTSMRMPPPTTTKWAVSHLSPTFSLAASSSSSSPNQTCER